jgi:hypothetical protein
MEYKKSLLKCLVLAAGTMLLGSCEKNFLNVNNSPNSPSSADPALVFSNALQQTAGVMTDLISGTGPSGANSLCYPMNYYSLSSNYQIDFTITRNDYTTNDFTNVWTDAYHNLNDYSYVITNSEAQGKWFLAAASKVMVALDYQILVDCYNDVPYTQALSLVDSGVSQPAYDKGQAVYNAILGQLDSAITIFETPSLLSTYSVGSADIMWGGQAPQWVQFANSLKLRILMHEVNVTSQASTIQAEMAKIAADPNGLMGPGVSASVNPGYASDAQNHVNPLYYLNGYTVTGALTTRILLPIPILSASWAVITIRGSDISTVPPTAPLQAILSASQAIQRQTSLAVLLPPAQLHLITRGLRRPVAQPGEFWPVLLTRL